MILLNTLLLLALAEGAARLAEFVHPASEDVTFEYAPYRMLKMTRGPWPLNRDGFRARELETYRNAFLIEFLGGSVCVGVGTNAGATIPERLEQALRQKGLARAQVLNLCQGGATSAQEAAIFIEYGLPLSPQVVVSFNGANDLLRPQPIGEDAGANLPYKDAQLRARVNGSDALNHLAMIRVAERLAARWRIPRFPNGPGVPDAAVVNSYLYSLGVVRTLTEAQGGEYAVLLQPTLHFEKSWSPEEAAMWRVLRPRGEAGLPGIVAARYGAAREALTKWSTAQSVSVYDLTAVFAHTGSTIYSDSVHFQGQQGYRLLFEELVRQGLLERLASRYRAWESSAGSTGS